MSLLKTAINQQQSDALFAFTNGIAEDARFAKQEVAVQKTWVNALAELGYLNSDEAQQVCASLDEALAEMEAGAFQWDIRNEDIHMHLEQYVTNKLGDLGKKMHLGRSRNDLIATTLRLFVKDSLAQVETGLSALLSALEGQATQTHDVIVPGMTHLQHGQPVRFGHILKGHVQGFLRDIQRLKLAANEAMVEMPLGSAALAGTTLPINLDKLAHGLGFSAPAANSYDAVGNRDFMLGALNALAGMAIHLGRLAEDCIYWASTPVGLLKLPQAWSTGSSIMPNKRNPDVPELTRGRCAHIIAAQTDGHVLMRTVPTSYGSDLHELKKVYLRALDETLACLSVWPGFIAEMEVNTTRAKELCNQGHVLATEIADDLVAKGASFRDAYQQVAALVVEADKQGKQVHEIYDGDVSVEKAMAKRNNAGGTA